MNRRYLSTLAHPQHSSVPPEHTGIGIAAQIVNALEENPFPVKVRQTRSIQHGN